MDDHHGFKYFIIDKLYIITSTVYINYKLIWWRNMNIWSYVEVGTPKYTFGSKGLIKICLSHLSIYFNPLNPKVYFEVPTST